MVTTVPLDVRAFLAPYVHHFKGQGWQVDLLTRPDPANAEDVKIFDQVWDVQWSRNPLDLGNFRETPRRIRQIVETEKYDLVHVHTPVAALITRYALRELRRQGQTKVIYTAHGFHFHADGSKLKNLIFLNLEKLGGRWTDYLVVINREDEQNALKHKIVPPDRLIYMPGIGLDRTYYSAQALSEDAIARVRTELGLKADERMMLMIAEFNPGKRHADTLRAFARLNRPDVHLTFAGKGPLVEPMRQLAAELGVGDRVHFLGFRHDIPALIRASVATLLPSEREGLPRSIMESLNLEVPVIGTDIRGVRDLLENSGGILVKVGDEAAIAAAMARLLDNPEEARRMGQMGQRHMEKYDLRNVIALHEQLYAQALGQDEPVPAPV